MQLVTTARVTAGGLRDVTGPATFGQRYMWDIIQSLEPHAEHLNIVILIEMTDRLTLADGLRVLRDLWSRHESFRTSFALSGGLVQDIRARVEFEVSTWRAHPDATEGDVRAALSGVFAGHFDVTEHAKARGVLVTDGDRVRWLAVVMCHLVTDGWSNMLLRRDIADLAAGRATPAADLVHPFDHAAFEQSDRGRRASEVSVDYWIRLLHDFPARFPAEVVRPAEQPRFRDVTMLWPGLGDAARAAAARLDVSPTVVITTVFAEMLADLTGLPDVPFLIRTANRTRPALVHSVGPYAQAAPLIVRTGPAAPAAVLESLLTAERRGYYHPVDLAERVEQTWPDKGSRPSCMITMNPNPSAADVFGEPPPPTPADGSRCSISVGPGRDEEHVQLYFNVALARGMALFVDTTFLPTEDAAKRLREMRTTVQHGLDAIL